MSALDKFKRRLVRDIARRIYQEKQPEEEMWQQLKKEYGCDCNLLWEHMRALTMKKLKRLLAAEDRVDYITRIARMTSTDWLAFDLVLVHDKVDVIGEDMILSGKPEPAVLAELLKLVIKYDIEYLASKNVVEAWSNLTKEYNTGGRQCSPMLLQRRWYQLKELTRSRVYNFWQLYRGNPKHLEKANAHRPSYLQLKVASRYPDLITQPFENWSDLILKKQIVLAGAFENRRILASLNDNNFNDPDLVVVEPNVETIELAADSDNDDVADDVENNEKSDVKNRKCRQVLQEKQNVGVTIKSEPPAEVIDVDGDENDVQLLQNIHIPINYNETILENVTFGVERPDVTDSELIDMPEINLPKITSVMGNVMITESYTEINELLDNKFTLTEPNLNDDDDGTKIILKNSLIENVTEPNKDVKTDNNEIGYNSSIVTNLDELPLELNFVDDGIELEDQDIDDVDEQKKKEGEDKQPKIEENEDETISEIDRNLIMIPVCYTKKLDHMNIFKDKSYVTIKGNDIINCVIAESKPIYRNVVSNNLNENVDEEADKHEDANKDINEDGNENQTDYDDSVSPKFPRVNYASWLLQKPKSRSYNPIQLCKNPDFNTRLKRLTVGFFSIERNRQLFNACKPVTIDVHKQFESKLVHNTLYLRNINSLVKQENIICDRDCKNTASVIPSATPVQSLLVNSKIKAEELLPVKNDNVKKDLSVISSINESNKVINLSDIDQLRLVNKNLLTAEISPLPLNDTSSTNKPPVQLITFPSSDPVDVKKPEISSLYSNFDGKLSAAELRRKRAVYKKINHPKVRSVRKMPPWSCLLQKHEDDSLITKDTLAKVLCLLNGIEFKRYKKKKRAHSVKTGPGTPEDNKLSTSNETNDCEFDENNDNRVNRMNDDEVEKSVAFLQTENEESSKVPEKDEEVRPYRQLPALSTFCCWARHKIELQNSERGPKYKHKCPKRLCVCCCREYLVEETLSKEKLIIDYDNGNADISSDKDHDIIESQNDNDTSILDDEKNKKNGVKKYPPSVEALECDPQTVSIDVTNNVKSMCSIKSPLLTNIVPNSFGVVQFEMESNVVLQPSVCLSNDVAVDTNDISLLPDSKRDKKSVPVTVTSATHPLERRRKGNTAKRLSTKKTCSLKPNKNPDTAIETISLLEDEPTDSTERLTPIMPIIDNSSKPILPKGVNLVLLPDNTLRVNLNPEVPIDQEIFSKLPDILTAVQKQLNGTVTTLDSQQTPPRSNEFNVDKSDCELNVANTIMSDQNSELNISSTMLPDENSELNVDNSNTKSNLLVVDHANNLVGTRFDNVNVKNCNKDTAKLGNNNSMNTSESISVNLNDHLSENDKSCTKDNTAEIGERQSGVVEEISCAANDNIKRKTILSDLMTMSGISPEDINTAVDVSVSLPPTAISSTLNNVIDSTILNNRNVIVINDNKALSTNRKRIIKKIMISIRKKVKETDTNSVIDLTDDNDVSLTNNSSNHEVQSDKRLNINTNMQSLLKKYVAENPKLMQISEIPKPVKLYKTSPKSLLKNLKQIVPSKNLDNHLKLSIAKHYRQLNRKPTNLKLLQINRERMVQENEHNKDGGSDSSDDEPLAKKFRRIREEKNFELGEDIVEVPKYDVPVEFDPESTDFVEKTDKIDSGSEEEGNCILGF